MTAASESHRLRARFTTVLLAVLCVFAPGAAADEPTGVIPSLRATVTGLSFFAGGDTVVPLRQRRYDDRFLADSLPFVYYQLDLSHPAPGRRLPFVIEGVWQGPQGVRRRDSHRFALEPSWVVSNWTSNARLVLGKTVTVPNWNDVFRCRGVTGEWGPCEASSDVSIFYWPRGTYRVDIFADGARVATNHFRVVGKADIDAEMRARISDASSPSGHVGALDGGVVSLRFFDGGPPVPRARDRRYAGEFPRGTTRAVGWHLDLKHRPVGRWRPLTFEALWYRLEQGGRRVVQRKVLQASVSADWTDTQFDDDSDPLPEVFQVAGRYLLELYADGKKVAAGTFTIR